MQSPQEAVWRGEPPAANQQPDASTGANHSQGRSGGVDGGSACDEAEPRLKPALQDGSEKGPSGSSEEPRLEPPPPRRRLPRRLPPPAAMRRRGCPPRPRARRSCPPRQACLAGGRAPAVRMHASSCTAALPEGGTATLQTRASRGYTATDTAAAQLGAAELASPPSASVGRDGFVLRI